MAPSSITVTVFGIEIDVIELQSLKQLLGIFVIPLPIITLFNAIQSSKQYCEIAALLTVTFIKLSHEANAHLPISVTEAGILKLFIPVL